VQVGQMIREALGKSGVGAAKPTLLRLYPKTFLALIVLMMIGIGIGSWLVFRSKPPRPLVIHQPAPPPTDDTQKPQSSQQSAPQPKAEPKLPHHHAAAKPATPSISQSGTGNSQTVVPGNTKQNSSGPNSPNVIGNNNSFTYSTPPPDVINNSQLAHSANGIASRLRKLQDSINWYMTMKRRENGGAIPVDFYKAQWSRIEPIRAEALELQKQILKRLPPQPENSMVSGVLVYDNPAGINPLYDVATYFDDLAQQLSLK